MTAVALDTNILLLLLIGIATGGPNGDRLKSYTCEDIVVLDEQLSKYDRLIVTPNVWTEVSNLWGRGLHGEWRQSVPSVLAELINKNVEIAHPSRNVTADEEFGRLGLTDCVWLAVLDRETVLITDDVALYSIALSRGLRVKNFNHLRNFE